MTRPKTHDEKNGIHIARQQKLTKKEPIPQIFDQQLFSFEIKQGNCKFLPTTIIPHRSYLKGSKKASILGGAFRGTVNTMEIPVTIYYAS